MPVKVLSERLRLDYGTLTPLLRRMESSGLVTRRRRAEDERSVEIDCTAKGSALEAQAIDLQPRIWAAFGLTRDEAVALQATLKRVAAAASAVAAPG